MAWNALVRDSASVTPGWVGEEWLTKTERMLRKTLRVREESVPPARQYDVLYADISADWRQAVQGIYDYLDLPLTEATCSAMQGWLDINRQHKHGTHKYSLASFGLDEDTVDQRLLFYRERFNIPYETSNPHKASA